MNLRDDAFALPGALRAQLKPMLPERAFLRRARSDGLFVTDAPRHTDSPIDLSPFLCTERNGLTTVCPGPDVLIDFEQRHEPPDFLCRTLLRFRGLSPSHDAMTLFATGVRLLESSDANERALYQRRVRNLAAVCLRTRTGGAYACALIAHLLDP